MNKAILSLLFSLLIFGVPFSLLHAQNQLSYGFKAGLNFSNFTGPLDAEETYNRTTGFHIGVIFKYPLTDLFGFKGEFVYSQRGGNYTYNGASFFQVQRSTGPLLLSGVRDITVNISNNCLDFPLLVYGRFGRFEASTGVNISLLAGSIGAGQLKFTGQIPPVSQFDLNLDYHYVGDKAGEASNFGSTDIKVNNETIRIPSQIGAYYEYAQKDGNLFKFLELGWHAGLSFYLNEGLFLGVRGNYGLTDVTRSAMDISYKTFTNNAPSIRNDKDKQVSYQVSLGFSF